MTRAFGDDQLELELRGVLHDLAAETEARAHTAAEMTVEIAPRLRSASARAPRWEATLRLAVVALVVLAVLALAIAFGARPSRPALNLLLAVDLPLGLEPGAPPIIDAVRLALRDAGGNGVTVALPDEAIFSDNVQDTVDLDRVAENIGSIAADARYVALIGPFHSFAAEAAIPITNAAGLLQCSPTNTAPGLTLGDGAAALRPRPDRPSYVRLATTDDAATEAAARLLVGVLGKRRVFVVSTVEPFAGGRSERVADAVERLGGSIVGRGAIGDGGDDPEFVAGQVRTSGAEAVFFDGPSSIGGSVLAALPGSPDVPFVGLDIILDGPRNQDGSFLEAAGANAANAYGVFQAGTDSVLGPQVEAAYAATYGHPADSFVLSGHACARVILDAIGRIDGSGLAGAAEWREALRAEVTAPGRTYRTAVGTIGFDANGDATPQRVSIYRGDAAAGDWTFWQMLELPPGG